MLIIMDGPLPQYALMFYNMAHIYGVGAMEKVGV